MADVVLVNGKIVTVDERFSVVEAVAVEGERTSPRSRPWSAGVVHGSLTSLRQPAGARAARTR